MKRTPHIQYVGLHEAGLGEIELDRADALVRRLARALATAAPGQCGVTVHIKAYAMDGARKKFSVHARYTAPGITLVSDRAHDWDLRAAIHAAFEHLESRLHALQERAREHELQLGRSMKSLRATVS